MTSASSGSGNDIVWYKGDGTGAFGPEQVIDATQNQAYTITFADFENDGDLDMATIAYGDDAVNIFRNELLTLSVPELTKSDIIIYPNPAFDQLFIKQYAAEVTSVNFYDTTGRLVLSRVISAHDSIPINTLVQGTYFVVIEGQNSAFKLIKY